MGGGCFPRSNKFFRSKILNLSREEILLYVQQIEKEARDIKKEALKICWYLRGIGYQEALNMSYEERMLVSDIVKDNLETTKKSGMPFF